LLLGHSFGFCLFGFGSLAGSFFRGFLGFRFGGFGLGSRFFGLGACRVGVGSRAILGVGFFAGAGSSFFGGLGSFAGGGFDRGPGLLLPIRFFGLA
jgi:hypothetical protein